MIVYPAIDLINGQCVRLYKGDFAQQTTYETSPVAVAQGYKAEGAEWMHLVDLDGARDSAKRQTALIADIIKASGLKVQTGGGVRSAKDVAALLKAGASRVVIGSLAVKDIVATRAIIKEFGAEKICLAMDVQPHGRDYMVSVHGWQEGGDVSLDALIAEYEDLRHVLCTDISRDGTMTGCNVQLYADTKKKFPHIRIQASGGVASLDDLRALDTDGVIIGKALYEGAFTVKQALEVAC